MGVDRMELTLLGTGAIGYPLAFCNCENCQTARKKRGKSIRKRASLLINDDLLIDLGPDTQTAMCMYNKDMGKIKYLLQTHIHTDHCDIGLLTTRITYLTKQKNQNLLELYAHPNCLNIISQKIEEYENVKLLITTILLSLVLTPVLFINKSFLGTMIVVIFVLSIIYFIAILFSKIRTLLVSKAYTCFLIATLALQSIYYACYYIFSLWENVTIKEWFKIVDEMVPGYPTTLYPEFVIPITELLMNVLALSFFFMVPYLIYLLVYLCRFLISKKKQS